MDKIPGVPDTTGPYGAGFGPGEGTGSGLGLEKDYSSGFGRGFGPGRGFGVPFCQCPNCEFIVKHARGLPCIDTNCPKCGTRMVGKNITVTLASYLRNTASEIQKKINKS